MPEYVGTAMVFVAISVAVIWWRQREDRRGHRDGRLRTSADSSSEPIMFDVSGGVIHDGGHQHGCDSGGHDGGFDAGGSDGGAGCDAGGGDGGGGGD